MFEVLESKNVPIKAWTNGVPVEDSARQQLLNVASLPFIHQHVAVMPDVHWGMGATIGSVIPTVGAIVPAAVGVDIGCGMIAVRTTLGAAELPDSLVDARAAIERLIPVGGPGERGSWKEPGRHGAPGSVSTAWRALEPGFRRIVDRHPKIAKGLTAEQLA